MDRGVRRGERDVDDPRRGDKPQSRIRTKIFPRQNGKRFSSIATEPWPWGLSCATRRYIGSIPSSVRATISRVASGHKAPAASAAIADR